MIIWLASFPKSGNTLVRSLLSSYFFSENGDFNFELLSNIKQFPKKVFFSKLGVNLNDKSEIAKNYIQAQKIINNKLHPDPKQQIWGISGGLEALGQPISDLESHASGGLDAGGLESGAIGGQRI